MQIQRDLSNAEPSFLPVMYELGFASNLYIYYTIPSKSKHHYNDKQIQTEHSMGETGIANTPQQC